MDLSAIRFDHDAWDRLILVLGNGTSFAGVEPVRCFPLSDPDRSIAILDSEGGELLTLPDLNSLNPAAREILQSELVARDFVPQILRIISVSNPAPPCQWTVETDRGQTSFQLESEDDIRKLGRNRILVADSNGIRYMITDFQNLDTATRRIIQRLV